MKQMNKVVCAEVLLAEIVLGQDDSVPLMAVSVSLAYDFGNLQVNL